MEGPKIPLPNDFYVSKRSSHVLQVIEKVFRHPKDDYPYIKLSHTEQAVRLDNFWDTFKAVSSNFEIGEVLGIW